MHNCIHAAFFLFFFAFSAGAFFAGQLAFQESNFTTSENNTRFENSHSILTDLFLNETGRSGQKDTFFGLNCSGIFPPRSGFKFVIRQINKTVTVTHRVSSILLDEIKADWLKGYPGEHLNDDWATLAYERVREGIMTYPITNKTACKIHKSPKAIKSLNLSVGSKFTTIYNFTKF
jgi:hypothetical protein